MRKIMGLSLLTGASLLFLSIVAGPWALYTGLAVAGLGLLALLGMFLQMVIG